MYYLMVRCHVVLGFWLACCGMLPAAVYLNRLETFDSPTTWTSGAGNPNPPAIVPDSGPLGSDDYALQITSTLSSMEGSRLIAFDQLTWVGNYIAEGVDALEMDLRNFSFSSSSMRVAIHGDGGWWVTPAVVLSAFSPWTSVSYDLSPGALLNTGGTDVTLTLSTVDEIRILHSTSPTFRGDTGQRSVLVDNIHAIPEPSVAALFAIFGMIWAVLRSRHSIS